MTEEEAGWAKLDSSQQDRKKIVNPFSFSNMFYRFQTNLNLNQILISMTSTHTINYKSTSSHKEKYATT
jgi:hypothetical protein